MAPPPERGLEEDPPDEPEEEDPPDEPDECDELLPLDEEPPDDGRLTLPDPLLPRCEPEEPLLPPRTVPPELPPRPLVLDEPELLGESLAPPIDPITRLTVSPVPPRHESPETTPRDCVALVELPEVEGLLTGSPEPPRITVRGLEEVVPPDEVEPVVVAP